MGIRGWIGSAAVALVLQGCVGTDGLINHSQQDSVRSLKLFAPGDHPRFALYLSCEAEQGCGTAGNAFSDWSSQRQFVLHFVAPGDPVFSGGMPATASGGDEPYRLAIRFAPVITPSFDESGGVHGDMRGGYSPPKVSYVAQIVVSDAVTGKRLLSMPVHEQRVAEYKANASPYIREEVDSLIRVLDPGYQQ